MNVVYVSHNGVETALVRSQVLPYLRRLARRQIDLQLITYERGPAAFPGTELPRVRWSAIPAQPGSGLGAKLVDIVRGAVALARVTRRADLIHARSYVPAVAAWLAGKITGTPFLFDMRGFLPDEYVDAGYWRAGEARYRVLRAAERILLRDTAEVVVLTRAAAERLRSEQRFSRAVRDKPVTVIPCAVELDRFRPSSARARQPTLVYSGSVGMWYLLDEMLEVYRRARVHAPTLQFMILNRGERGLIEATLAGRGASVADVDLRAAEFGDMPALVASGHAAIALLRRSPSKLGSSPIKVAEYLACGLPVVVNAGLGDTDELVDRYGAGHVMRSFGEAAMDAAGRALAGLLTDEGARTRARALAEAEYDADRAADRYAEIYARVLSIRRAA